MKNNQKIIVSIGISGAMKSSWAAIYMSQNKNWTRVNRDSLREQLTGLSASEYNKSPKGIVEKHVNDLQHEQIRYALNRGFNVIIDNTHLKKSYIDDIIFKYNHLADIELKWFYSNVKYAQKLVAIRDFNAAIDAEVTEFSEHTGYIERQQGQFDSLVKQGLLDFYPQTKSVLNNTGTKDCIICDLDGTLAEHNGREKSCDPFVYDRDFEKDHVVKAVQEILLKFEKDTEIIFVSGREDKGRKMTEDFLYKAGIFKYQLFMRKTGDMRRDSIIKRELYEAHIEGKYKVLMAIDDRLQVIEECWNKLGIFTLNVNQTNNRF